MLQDEGSHKYYKSKIIQSSGYWDELNERPSQHASLTNGHRIAVVCIYVGLILKCHRIAVVCINMGLIIKCHRIAVVCNKMSHVSSGIYICGADIKITG